LDEDARRYRDAGFGEAPFRRSLVVGNKTGSGIRTDNAGATVFQEKTDERAIQTAPAKGIGVVNDQVASCGECGRTHFDLCRVDQQKFVI
jgi:hypothetical protein